MKHEIIVDVQVAGEAPQALVESVITATLAAEGVTCPCEVSVLFVEHAEMTAINLEQREINATTDVLSFPMFTLAPGTPPQADLADPGTGLVPLGDMVLNMAQAAEQAEEYGHGIRREVAYLTVHSILHLLGYDHMDDGPQKIQMRDREEAILATLAMTREEL